VRFWSGLVPVTACNCGAFGRSVADVRDVNCVPSRELRLRFDVENPRAARDHQATVRFDVFLTWNGNDAGANAAASVFVALLEQDGLRVTFPDPAKLVAGEPEFDEVGRGLRSAKCAFVLYGERGLGRLHNAALFSRGRFHIQYPYSPDLVINRVLLPGAADVNKIALFGTTPPRPESTPVLDLRQDFFGGRLSERGVATVLAAAGGASRHALARSHSEAQARTTPAARSSEPLDARRHSPQPAASATLNVFISYRREDSEGHTGRLYDDLAPRLAPKTSSWTSTTFGRASTSPARSKMPSDHATS
jgi:hypothetical protein